MKEPTPILHKTQILAQNIINGQYLDMFHIPEYRTSDLLKSPWTLESGPSMSCAGIPSVRVDIVQVNTLESHKQA